MGTRYFASIDIDDKDTRERLEQVQNTVTQFGVNSPTAPEQFHITLNFSGELDEDGVKEMRERLDRISQQSFELEIRGLGVFPRPEYISVVWAGTGEGTDEVTNLAAKVRGNIDDSHVQEHAFHPHITLMRLNNISQAEKHELQDVISGHEETSLGRVNVDSFKLKQSTLTESGAEHTVVKTYDLE